MTNQEKQDWEKEFDEKVNELRNAEIVEITNRVGQSAVVYFGYRVRKENELFKIVDFGNIKSFIRQAIQQAREEERERILKDINNIWDKYHINNYEDDGFRDSKDEVIEKFMSALKEQISYFTAKLKEE